MDIKPMKRPVTKSPVLWVLVAIVILIVVIWISWNFYSQLGVLF